MSYRKAFAIRKVAQLLLKILEFLFFLLLLFFQKKYLATCKDNKVTNAQEMSYCQKTSETPRN